jgi:hypothetical protein
MLTELAIIGGVVVAVTAWLEASAASRRHAVPGLEPETAIREAMRGPEGPAVAAEYRRRLILRRPECDVRSLALTPPL